MIESLVNTGAIMSSDDSRPTAGLSYVRGRTQESLSELTVFRLLDQAAKQSPGSVAAVFRAQSLRLSWLQLIQAVEQCAAGLWAMGVRQADRVGIWAPNRVEWLITQFATARIGAILVNINPAYRVAELEYALNKSGVSVLVSAFSFKGTNYLALLEELGFGLENGSSSLKHLRSVIHLGDLPAKGMCSWQQLMNLGKNCQNELPDEQGLSCHDAINIQFTSGTTGAPKGATLTHHNIVNNAIAVARCMRLSDLDALCIPVPLYHCFGMVLSVLACVSSRSTMVFPGESFEPRATLEAVDAEKCTALHGVPTMFIAALDHPDFANFSLASLRTGIMAGAPCPIEVMKRVQRDMHMGEVTIAYGMTETSPVSFQSSIDDPLHRRVSTVGQVLPHLEVKIVDENGQLVPIGQMGELCTKGYSVMQGYWNDPERTAEVVINGWMHTGDLAVIDDAGYCNIVGRLKDMVIRGGENVYPREVEEFLYRHPRIAAVQVFGVPDPKYGEQLAAWIVLKPGSSCKVDEIRSFCHNQIAHFKVPHYIEFVTEIPMTVTGKPQKYIMREEMVRRLGLQEVKSA